MWGVWSLLLTVTVSPDPTLITESGSLRMDSLKALMSLRVHIDAADIGGRRSSTNTPNKSHNYNNHHQMAALTVAVDSELIFITLSGFFLTLSLKIFISFLVHTEAGISGGIFDVGSLPGRPTGH